MAAAARAHAARLGIEAQRGLTRPLLQPSVCFWWQAKHSWSWPVYPATEQSILPPARRCERMCLQCDVS
eukprot:5303411-Lingulodinium_polyedra.AAC.1